MQTFDKDIFDTVINFLELIIIAGSSYWAYIRFIKEEPLHPRIEFDIAANFYGPHHSAYLAAISISAHNKGNIQHDFEEIFLEIRGIKKDMPLNEFQRYPTTVQFPIKIVDKIKLFRATDSRAYSGPFFVRPGVNQTFSYATQVPADMKFIVVKTTFYYQGQTDHTAERIFEVSGCLSRP